MKKTDDSGENNGWRLQRELQKTLIDFGEDEVKIRKMPLIKKHEKNDSYVHDMLDIKLHYPHVQQSICTLF